MTNLNMNATSNSQYKTVNTDGTDTWNSKDIVISNWTVTCGDVREAKISSHGFPFSGLLANMASLPGLHFNQRK